MMPLDLRYEADASGTEFPLAQGIGGWIDDLIAGGVIVIIASVLVSRAYRWVKAQGDHPRDAIEAKMRHLKEAGDAAGRALRGGTETTPRAASAPDEVDLEPHISIGSPSQA